MAKQLEVSAMDLGNGFHKRSYDGEKVLVDPSVYALPVEFFRGENKDERIVSVGESGRKIYLGNDAFDSGLPIKSALGDSDLERYEAPEFKELLYGFLAKDMREDTDIELAVMGLPIAHFTKKKDLLQETVKGRKIAKVGSNEVLLNIKNCIAIPQPIGTYAYLESVGYDTSGRTLVVDGGFGTLDITEMKGQEVISYYGKNLGMKQAYLPIMNVVESEYAGFEVNINQIPEILEKGIKIGGSVVYPAELPKVNNVLNTHFNDIYSFIIQNYGSTLHFDNVVWTGGLALAHKDRIQGKEQGNFMILEDGQTANSLGYYEFGKGLLSG